MDELRKTELTVSCVRKIQHFVSHYQVAEVFRLWEASLPLKTIKGFQQILVNDISQNRPLWWDLIEEAVAS